MPDAAQAKRQAHSTRAWKKAVDHLCSLAGHHGCRITPALEAVTAEAEKASLAYVAGDKDAGAGKALARFEAAHVEAIKSGLPVDRKCRTCGEPEPTIILIAHDGDVECSKCRRGVVARD
jgi:nucleotide-binding universal stress UspA family protein